jgi:hypothetical protein
LKITSGAPLRKAGSSSSGEIMASPRRTPFASLGVDERSGLARSFAE